MLLVTGLIQAKPVGEIVNKIRPIAGALLFTENSELEVQSRRDDVFSFLEVY